MLAKLGSDTISSSFHLELDITLIGRVKECARMEP